VRTPDVARGLAWVAALHARELQLLGQVSEVDVGDAQATLLHLASGTRVRGPAWPPGVRDLSALRTVLADLARRGQTAEEVDVRFRNQVIVRPVEPSAAAASSRSG
jgi:predicted nucleic acid-binding Zn ribbon protein